MPKNKTRTPRKGGRQRQISVRGVLRHVPDLEKLAGTVAALAIAQAEKEAQDQKEATHE